MILVTTFPWGDFVGHSHWNKVNWVPFCGPHDELRDVALNILAFVPLGYLAPLGRGWLTAVLAGAILVATTAEAYQVFTHSRIPSVTDIAAAGIGAWLGVWMAGLRVQRRRTIAQSASRCPAGRSH